MSDPCFRSTSSPYHVFTGFPRLMWRRLMKHWGLLIVAPATLVIRHFVSQISWTVFKPFTALPSLVRELSHFRVETNLHLLGLGQTWALFFYWIMSKLNVWSDLLSFLFINQIFTECQVLIWLLVFACVCSSLLTFKNSDFFCENRAATKLLTVGYIWFIS